MVEEVRMYFDVWAADDLQGDAIGTLTELEAAQIRVVDNGMGSGEFTINRNSTEFSALCATDNLVRVRLDNLGPYAFDSANYVHAFFIEEGEDNIISADEEGGQTVRIVGRGGEAYLSRAIIDYVTHHPFNQTPIDFAATALDDGQWHINDSDFVSPGVGTAGSVLRIFLRDAEDQSPEPIPLVSPYPTGHDFNVTHDSLGTPWDTGATDWSFDVGTDLLTVLGILVQGGLYYKMDPSLLLHAYEERPGTDLSGSISFQIGVNIVDSGTRQIHASTAKSRVLVRGANSAGRFNYHWSEDTDVEDFIGVRQGYTEYGSTPTSARLERAGQKLITALKNQHDGPPIIGVVHDTGAIALVDYKPGDTVALDVPDFSGNYRIHAISLVMNEIGSADPIIEFTEDAVEDFANPIAETKSGCCGCSSGEAVDDTDPPAYIGEVYVGGVGETLTGSGTENVPFVDQTNDTRMQFVPGTAFVIFSDGTVGVGTEDAEHGRVAVTSAPAGDARVFARVNCDPTPQGEG